MHDDEEAKRQGKGQPDFAAAPLEKQKRYEDYLHGDQREVERGGESGNAGHVEDERPLERRLKSEEHSTGHVARMAVGIVAADAEHSQDKKGDKQSHRADIEKGELQQADGARLFIAEHHQLHHVESAEDENGRFNEQGSPA